MFPIRGPGLFTYFYYSQVQRSVKHFIPSDSSSSLSLWAHPILNSLSTSRISWSGKQRTAAENSFICVWFCLLTASHLSAQGWSCKPNMTARFQTNSGKKNFSEAARASAAQNWLRPWTEDDYFITQFYTCSLGTPTLIIYSVDSHRFDLPLFPVQMHISTF